MARLTVPTFPDHAVSLRTIAESALQGEPRAFDTLFADSMPRLIAFIRARVGGVVAAKESPQDLAQSVCVEALQDLESFEFRGEEPFRRWLFVRALRKIVQKHRFYSSQKRDAGREIEAALAAPSEGEATNIITAYATLCTPSRNVNAKEQLAQIEAALSKLPETQRTAVAMTRVGGLTYREAAEELGKTESAVRALVMRGLATLAEYVEVSPES